MKIGYLGPKGTFSEAAALAYGKGETACEYIAFDTIVEVLDAVAAGEVEEGVAPLENSIEGTVTSTIDMLIFNETLFIMSEIVIPVSENMLVATTYANEPITKILSHPQALGQCAGFVKCNYPKSKMTPVASTAEAARIVAEGEKGIACLSTAQAAKVYDLKTLHENVQDETGNVTRFVIVSRKQMPAKAQYCKSSIVFSTKHKPGELYRILDILNIWDINMTKIESRPGKQQLGEYVFFVDFEAENQGDLDAAMKMIARKATFFKFLGSYPIVE